MHDPVVEMRLQVPSVHLLALLGEAEKFYRVSDQLALDFLIKRAIC